jgi:hypothetical protein
MPVFRFNGRVWLASGGVEIYDERLVFAVEEVAKSIQDGEKEVEAWLALAEAIEMVAAEAVADGGREHNIGVMEDIRDVIRTLRQNVQEH